MKNALFLLLVLHAAIMAHAKDNWIEQMHKLQVANASNPDCKIFYKTGEVIQTPTGAQIAWGMTEKMWKWYSSEGVKKYPSVCLVSRAAPADVEIVFNLGGSEQVQGADIARTTDTSTSSTNINANVSGDVNANINGTANTSTTTSSSTAVPYTRTFKPLSVYVFRTKDNALIGTASMLFTNQVGGTNSGFYNLGAAIGSSHHLHRLFDQTLQIAAASGATNEGIPPAHPVSAQLESKPTAKGESAEQPSSAKLQVESSPIGADIEIDGEFVGNTPSEIQTTEGEHTVSVRKAGFKDWQRKLRVSAGSNVHLSAELEKSETP